MNGTVNAGCPSLTISGVYLWKAVIGFLAFLFAFLANVITVIPLFKNVRKQPTYFYIINLALSNLAFASFVNAHDAIWNLTVQW